MKEPKIVVSFTTDPKDSSNPKFFDLEKVGELRKAFDRVADPRDWRNPIDTEIYVETREEVELIKEAITFFTATVPTADGWLGGKVRFKSEGYRNGPAGP